MFSIINIELYHQKKVFLSSFYFKGNIIGFHPKSQLLNFNFISPYLTVEVEVLKRYFRGIVYILGPRCNKPLGLQNGRIRSSQLSASSSWDRNHGPNNGRLYFHQRGKSGAWCARHNNRLQWYQVNFGRATRVVKVATQGRKDYRQWVTQYYLSFSQDGIHFAEYKQNSNRKVRESRLMFHVDSELRFLSKESV